MAHNNEWQLRVLLELLDYPENEIFLHIDKKSKGLQGKDFDKIIKRAKLYVYSAYSVYWGDISQTKCQMYMLQQAVTMSYHDYYHLISGSDLPIKSNSTIQKFFKDNCGKQFVHFESDGYCLKSSCRYYHILEPLIVRIREKRVNNFLNKIEKWMINIQVGMNVRRHLYCGANWYSITQGLAEDILANSNKMLRKVKYTISSDEYILQTFIRENGEKYSLYDTSLDNYHSIMRNIDWERGNPYIWRTEDYHELIESDYLFARKFDEKVDSEIIQRIRKYVYE